MRSLVKLNFVLLALMLAGCTTYHPTTIGVSDRNGLPVQGASVTTAPLYFFNATSEGNILAGSYEILEPFPAKGDGGVTDKHGMVQIEIVTQNPVDLHVYAEGHIPWKGIIAITKQGDVEINTSPSDSLLRVTSKSE